MNKPYYQDEWVSQYYSDALTMLSGLVSGSVDFLCSDPPYGIGFMGKDWDKALPDINVWEECLRVLKPVGLAKCTHRLVVWVAQRSPTR